jgi:uncharacterized repeat protein (TIGR03803 family)
MHRYLGVVSASILACGLAFGAVASAQAGNFKVLDRFKGVPDVDEPSGVLIEDGAGDLYGVSAGGGTSGNGTVFKLTANGIESVLYSFKGTPDGAAPFAGLIADGAGNLYGTTEFGGRTDQGTVFVLAPSGAETILYNFCSQANCADGIYPESGLIADKAGNLYGTTQSGGANKDGTVYRLAPDGTETVLYSFCSKPQCADGFSPLAGVVADDRGNLFGTASNGGAANAGLVFKLARDGAETVLYTFCSVQNCADGSYPNSVIRDKAGNLFGSTAAGGNTGCNFGVPGCGTVFEISPNGTESVLYQFKGGSDGAYPVDGLVMDKAGNLYGTTYYGGETACSGQGCGTIFKLAQDGTETVLHSFAHPKSEGTHPLTGLLRDTAGNLFGTTPMDGRLRNCILGCGTVFELSK